MTSLRRILRALDEDHVSQQLGKRHSASSPLPAYVFDDDADEAAREEARLRAVASLAGTVDDAIRRIEAEGAHSEQTLLSAVAQYLAEAEAHDAALRAFFSDTQKDDRKEEHVPTVGLWALAAVGHVCPARVLRH